MYLLLKEKAKKKLQYLNYDIFRTQENMTCGQFCQEKINLLFGLQSKTYSAKMNFKQVNRGDLNCIFQCNEYETQLHIFEPCKPVRKKLGINSCIKIDNTYGSVTQQKETIIMFLQIHNGRKQMKSDIQLGVGALGCAMGRLAS